MRVSREIRIPGKYNLRIYLKGYKSGRQDESAWWPMLLTFSDWWQYKMEVVDAIPAGMLLSWPVRETECGH